MASRRNRKISDDAPAAKLDKATLRKTLRIFRYLRPHWPIFAFGLVCIKIDQLLDGPGLGVLIESAIKC